MSAKLGYRVIFATSSDNGHHPEELEIRNSIEMDSEQSSAMRTKGKGWQSARFCDYPQELVVSLNSVSEVTQIQILSHQAKISSKIEIWIGLDAANSGKHDYSTYKSIDWKRLGYLSLDKNERSNWKARELKSVYINATANYIRFSIHESHINTINLFNQVGVVALTVLGEKSAMQSDPHQKQLNAPSSTSDQRTSHRSSAIPSNPRTEDSENIDENTSRKIRELMILKKQAVEQEDYDEAKRCKLCIENLQSAAKQLFVLEREKKQAVEKEDYDAAKHLKLEIERLRALSLNPDRPPPPPVVHQQSAGYGQPPLQSHYGQPPVQPSYGVPQSQFGNVAHTQPQQNQPHFAAPAQTQQQPPYAQPQRHEPVSAARFSGHHQEPQPPPPQQQPPMYSRSGTHSETMSPQYKQQQSMSQQRPEDRQIRPMKRNYSAVDMKNANPFGVGGAVAQSSSNTPLPNGNPNANAMADAAQGFPDTQSEQPVGHNRAVANGGLGVGGQGPDAKGPPPLKAAVKKGATAQIEMFGEATVRLLNSPNWNHRDEGLKAVGAFVEKKEHPDARQVFKLSVKAIYRALQDRVAGVILGGVALLNRVMGASLEVGAQDMVKLLHSVLVTLVNVLGHSNNRLVDAAGSMLISLCHQKDALYRAVFGVLAKKMKKVLPAHLKGRGLILLRLLSAIGLPKGADINAMMDNLVLLQLTNKNGDVRDVGMQTTSILYGAVEVRSRVVAYLEAAGLNDFIKEALNQHFAQVSGDQNVLEREPKSQKEQSRPSKAMVNPNKPPARKPKPKPKRRRRPQQQQQQQQSAAAQTAAAAPPPKQAQQEAIEQEEEEEEDVCNFCGLRDQSFVENEENLDLHYWQSCPMLTSCRLCEQVIEIATLHEHILTECESGIKHELCRGCNVPYPESEMARHQAECDESGNSLKCPLCMERLPKTQFPWKAHLLRYPGCPKNPRPLN